MSVNNLISGAPDGKPNRLTFALSDFQITAEHTGALSRAMARELKRIRTADRYGSPQSTDRYMLAYDLVAPLTAIAADGNAPFDASDYDLTQDHFTAVDWLADREAKAVDNSWAIGGMRSLKDYQRLREIAGFVQAVVEAGDAA